MKATLEQLFTGLELSEEQACESLLQLTSGKLSDAEIAAFLTAYRMRIVSIAELRGFRSALMSQSVSVDLSDFNTIDIVGTGGDGKNTFNISTAACFVVAGAGYQVAKHGNYGSSSVSGSSHIFEYYGYQFTNKAEHLRRNIEEAGLCFLHAPLFHPALKQVASVRKKLAVPTLFNILGPIVNPSEPKHKVIGCNNYQTMNLYNQLLLTDNGNFITVHAVDGYDEVSLTGNSVIGTRSGVEIIKPESFGFSPVPKEALSAGKTIKDAAQLFLRVLKNESSEAQRQVVLANASLAIKCCNQNKSLMACLAEAEESLVGGRAYKVFQKLMNCQ